MSGYVVTVGKRQAAFPLYVKAGVSMIDWPLVVTPYPPKAQVFETLGQAEAACSWWLVSGVPARVRRWRGR